MTRLAALEREPLLPDVLGLQEGLERLGRVEPAQDAQLLLAATAWRSGRSTRSWIQRALAPGPGCACTRCRRVRQYESRSTPRMSRSFIIGLPPKPPVGELAVEVPQGQAVLDDVEVGVAALAVLQRVGVGHQVAAHPVGVDQLLHPGGLVDVVVVRGGDVPDPADRLVRDAQRAEDLVVEAVLAEQQLVHAGAGTRRTARPG